MYNKMIVRVCAVTALSLISGSVFASTATATLAVSASISQNCSISTTPLAFGAYDPVVTNASTPLNQNGSVTVACTKGASGLTVGMDNGLHVSGTQRQMLGGTSANDLQYNLFQPPNNTPGTACTYPGSTAWSTTGGGLLTLSSPASKAGRTYNVCGTIPAGQDVSVDSSYTDSVTATINF